MTNIDFASPNTIQQLCFSKLLSQTNSLGNKFEPRPFLEHTGMSNIDLASTNNIQQLCLPRGFSFLEIKLEPRPVLEHSGTGNIDLASLNDVLKNFPLKFFPRPIFEEINYGHAHFWNILEW